MTAPPALPVPPPPGLAAAVEAAWTRCRAASGYLTEREARFLALLAAATPARGVILEIGCFKGKSTVALASIAARYGLGPVVAVDPHTTPSVTDPDLRGQTSSWADFQATLRAAEVEQAVEAHRAFSHDLARGWARPIRLLWIDGDHTHAGAKQDLDLFRAHLVDGAVVALHDVLHTFEGPIRVFVEELLRSDHFGPAGVCGSIGWAQFRPADGRRWRQEREALAQRAGRLIPFVEEGRQPRGMRKVLYKLARARVPHGVVKPEEWLATITAQ
ncbi:MAG: class I SAM-dependent methyltransferase [Gemmatimonadales bacterium]